MKESFKFYKTANISYMSRGNKDLKKDMVDMIMCLQKDTDDQGRYIPAKVHNIEEKFQSVIDWFDGKIMKKDIDDSKSLTSTQLDLQFSAAKHSDGTNNSN